MNKKRVLIFSLVYYPNFIGGAEVALKEITDRLGDEYEFDMVTLRLDRRALKEEKIGNITVHRVGWTDAHHGKAVSPDSLPWYLHLNKYAMLLTAYWRAIGLARKHKYFAIWSMMATYNSFAALFFKLANPSVPFILTLQEGDPIPFIKRRALPLWPLFKMIFRKADVIQTISNYLADFAKDMGARSPVVVVPNGVDVTKFAASFTNEEMAKIKDKISKKDGDITLITTSRLVTKNAVEDIISAMPLMPPNVKLIVAGRGYMADSLFKQALILGVQERIKFISWIPHSELPKYLKACDIFIRTPISEGFGNSFVEAMASGIPVVATPVGGIVDFLKDRETGVFAQVRDHQSIADSVMELVRNPELVSKIRRNAFEMVKTKYDWNKIAEEMKKIFDALKV